MLEACVLTLIVEMSFFACTRYRREKLFMPLCAAVNVATNLNLNLWLAYLPVFGDDLWYYILAGEVLVVLAEYVLYAKATKPSRRLFGCTLIANLLSFSVGLLLIPWK